MIRATFAGFSVALTALQENSKRLDVTSQNIANMNVEGYTRQSLNTSSVNYENPVSFYMNENDVNVGYGVSIDEVTQLRDQFLDIQYRDQNSLTEYNNQIDKSYKSIETYLDETGMDSIRSSLDTVQTALTTMQDTSKVQDPVYQGQLMSTMSATANLLNTTADSLTTAEVNEFHRIDGTGTSERGAIQEINDLLAQIGKLNDDIKYNQILGNKALELLDQRNAAIDKLSGYVPIEVSYYTEKKEYLYSAGTTPATVTLTQGQYDNLAKDPDTGNYHFLDNATGKTFIFTPAEYAKGSLTMTAAGEVRDMGYNYDVYGNITGKSSYPDDLRIDLKYTEGSVDKTINLVYGTSQTLGKRNYGAIDLNTGNENSPLGTSVKFTKADSWTGTGAVTSMTTNLADTEATAGSTVVRMASGSLQASLDMLSHSGYKKADGTWVSTDSASPTYRSYDYYMHRLDDLAVELTKTFNDANYKGTEGTPRTDSDFPASSDAVPTNGKTFMMYVNRGTQDETGVSAANIAISNKWTNGTTKIGLLGSDSNETILDMIQGMTTPHSKLDNKTFADCMNNISTTLANNESQNLTAQKINKTVLNAISESKDQISGVSLDEEAANMMTYVSAYNAASKIMNSYNDMLETLLGLVR